MVLKYLNWIVLLGIIQCWWFTTRAAQINITLNGSSSSKTLKLNDTLAVTCTVTSNSTVSSFYVRRNSRNFQYFGNTNTGTMNKTVTCDDNTYFRCYARVDGSSLYSTNIQVTVECPPTWSETVQQPVVLYRTKGEDRGVNIYVRGQPRPTYIVQKYTSTGLQDLPITVDLKTRTDHFQLYFRIYSEESHGIYQIKANNSLGTFTTNITLRGITLPPKNVRAWSTTPNTIHVEWTAGELFDTSSTYYIYYKSKGTNWKYKYIKSTNSTLTYIFKSFQPNTTYYFLVRSYYSKYGTSVYSNLIQATTLSPGDPPQTKPPIYEPKESTSSPATTTTSTRQPATTITPTRQPATTITSTRQPATTITPTRQPATTITPTRQPATTIKSTRQSTTKPELNTETEKISDTCEVCKPDNLTFEVGIGVGIGIGLVLLIIAVMATVIYFKSSHVKGDDILQAIQNSTREREADDIPQSTQNSTREREAERIYMNVAEHPYDQLSYTNAGLTYDNNKRKG